MELTNTQKLLLNGLELYGVEKEAWVGIMLLLKEPEKTETMLDWMADNQKATQEDILLKAVEIHKQK